MSRGKFVHAQVVVHVTGEVGLGVHVLHPLLEGEVVDTASLGAAVGQVPLGLAHRALSPVCVLVLSALHFGVGGVPVRYTHFYAYWDDLQCFQSMPFEDCHDLLELPHVVVLRHQGAGELPDIFG